MFFKCHYHGHCCGSGKRYELPDYSAMTEEAKEKQLQQEERHRKWIEKREALESEGYQV